MTQPSPPRAERDLTRPELDKVLGDRDTKACDWPIGNLTFYGNRKLLAIVSTNAAGADTREVRWAVKYPNDIAFLLDWREIKSLPDGVKRIPK